MGSHIVYKSLIILKFKLWDPILLQTNVYFKINCKIYLPMYLRHICKISYKCLDR
jgi:hypothetical protein